MRFKGFSLIIAAALSFMNFSAAALAAESVAQRTITVAVSEDIPNTIDRVMFRALEAIGCDMKVSSYGTVSAMATVDSGEIDALALQIPQSADDYQNLVQVPEPITALEFCVFARKGESEAINGWRDFSGKSVGFVFQRPYRESKMPEDVGKLVNLHTEWMVFQSLVNRNVDYAIMSRAEHEVLIAPEGIELIAVLEKQDVYTYVNKKVDWIVPQLAQQYKKMKADGTMERLLLRQDVHDQSDRNDILHISSFNSDTEIEQRLNEGFFEVIDSKQFNIFSYMLDAKRYPDDQLRNQSIINMIRSDFIDSYPDVIMASGNDAYEFIKQYYHLLFMGVPVVVCGVNGFDQASFGEFSINFAGVVEAISAYDTAELILQLYPDTTQIYVINGYEGTDLIWRNQIEKQLEPFKDKLVFSPNVPMEELLAELRALPPTAVVLNGIYFTDSTGKYYLQSEAQKLFDKNTSVPSFGMISVNVGYGQIGGKCTDPYNQGKYAGQVVFRVLSGESIHNIEVEVNSGSLNNWIFDADVLKHWNISESKLPKNSVLINKKLTMMQTNPTEFMLLMILIIGALIAIGALINMTNQLSKKNKQLHTTEELLAKDNQIRELSRRSQLIVSSAPLGFVLTKDDIITEINSYAEQRFGLNAGDRFAGIFDDKDAHEEIATALNDFGYFQNAVNTLITVGGEHNRFLTNGTIINSQDGVFHANWVMDVEDLERKKDEIKRAQEDFEKIILALPSPVVLFDFESMSIIYCNQCFMDLFGFTGLENVMGMSYYDLFPEYQPDGSYSKDGIDRNIRSMLEGRPTVSLERVFRLLDNTHMEMQASSGLINYNERQTVIVIARDITAEKEQQNLLQSIAEKEKESNITKSRFLVNMSHEIRTPMNAIIGLSEIALRRPRDPDSTEIFSKINDSAKILLNIINDILDFSKIEAEKLDFVNEEFEIEEALSNAMLVSMQRIGDKPVEMLLDVDANVPCKVVGDKTRFWQVLKNFLDNSAKFTAEGRIICEVYVCEADAQRIWIGVTVSDTGTGISETDLEHVFVPFEQFGNSAQSKIMGTGLGMSIAKQMIELMGGSISISSKLGEGTKIDFVLPFGAPKKRISFKDIYQTSGLRGLRVLLADNDHIARGVMESLLDVVGVKYTSAVSGEEAIKRNTEANGRGEPFDIIVLDYHMEGIDGIQTAESLRGKIKPDSKILLVSAYSKLLTDDVVNAAGIEDIIEKPFSPTVFYKKLMTSMGIEINVKEAVVVEKVKFSGARVLVCEDNVINQEVARGMLEEFGIDAVIAENGIEALRILEKQDFDLIFMDILMPGMDGHETTLKIRGSGRLDLPIIAMTANVMQEEIKKCMEEGMNGHIAKPIEFEKLQAKLIKWLPDSSVITEKPKVSTEIYIRNLDTSAGMQHFGDKKESYIAAIKLFLKEYHRKHLNFANAVAESNAKKLMAEVHNIAGVAATIGAHGIHKIAREFESQLRINRPDILVYNEMIKLIAELHDAVVEALGDIDI